MDIERNRNENGNLISGSSVVISARQPIELDPKFGERVLKNMEAGICYDYFFQVDHYSVRMVAQLTCTASGSPIT